MAQYLVDVSDIFLFFFLLGGGEGGVRGDREGGWFLLKIPEGGGSPGGGGDEGPGGWLQRIGDLGGGEDKYSFFGAEMSTKYKTSTDHLFVAKIGSFVAMLSPLNQCAINNFWIKHSAGLSPIWQRTPPY